MRNQTSFRLTTTLLPTDTTAKTTDVINKVDSCGCKFKPDFTEETVVLTNDDRTIMETTRAYSCNGALCFTKRGLSDDNTETEIANRKLTWNPGTLAFVTAGAGDRIDPDDNITWTGNQTYTGNLVSCGCATYNGILDTKKGVKYPNFANVTCLQAYDSPYAGMFATVDDTGELYRYNANTCCWDMVSSVALGTYEIRCCSTRPDSSTAETIVSIVPSEGQLYLGCDVALEGKYYADVLMVGGGGGSGGQQNAPNSCGCVYYSGGGGGGMVLECNRITICKTTNYCVGAGGAGGASYNSVGSCGCTSCFGGLAAYGGGGGSYGTCNNGTSALGGGGGGGGAHIGNPMYGSNGHCGNSDYFGGWSNNCGGGAISSYQYTEGGYTHCSSCGVSTYFTGASMELGKGGNTSNPTTCGSGGRQACAYCCSGTVCPVGGNAGNGGVIYVRYPKDGSYGYTCATGGTKSEINVGGICYYLHTITSGSGCFQVIS